jgi:hypothetical protein
MPKRLRVQPDSDEENGDESSPEGGNASGDEPSTSLAQAKDKKDLSVSASNMPLQPLNNIR